MKVSKDFGYTRLSEIDYEGDYLPATGIVSNSRGAYGYILLLSSNVLVRIGIGTGCLDNEQNPDGTCVTRVYKNIIFKVDINGFDKPNVIGKDVFNMTFDLRKKAFGFHNYGSSTRQSVLNNWTAGKSRTIIRGFKKLNTLFLSSLLFQRTFQYFRKVLCCYRLFRQQVQLR